MKKTIFSVLSFFLIISCGNEKDIQHNVSSGNYDAAIDMAKQQIIKKKGSKGADKYISLLKEAYDKAVEKDYQLLQKAQVEENPEKWKTIYDTYLRMDTRQYKIKPLLPLKLFKSGKEVSFKMENYDKEILNAKNHLVAHLYKKANILLDSGDKKKIREAYDILDEIDRIAPNFKDVRKLMDVAHRRGTTYALVEIKNQTDKVIPKKLENELLNFSSYGASNFWVDYHNKPINGVKYDYKINLIFTGINISPDQQREKEVLEEKVIQDGYTYQRDNAGNVVRDSLGKAIKIPRMIRVRSRLKMHQQYKEAQVQARAEILDNNTGRRLNDFPLQSKYIFDYRYATAYGDRRAIRREYLDFLDKRPIQFPTNEQMIYDASKEIKMKFKDILNQADFL